MINLKKCLLVEIERKKEMTSHHLVAHSIEKLKRAHIRITPQRYGILEYLIENDNHPTADEIYQALSGRFPNMSVATVYNNLRLFTK